MGSSAKRNFVGASPTPESIMTNKNQNFGWPHAFATIAGSLAFAAMVWASSYADAARYNAEVEHNKNRIEYDKWLIEHGYIDEPRIR